MIERLGPANIPQIQRLFERCSDFFELVEWIAAQSGTTLWIAVQNAERSGRAFLAADGIRGAEAAAVRESADPDFSRR